MQFMIRCIVSSAAAILLMKSVAAQSSSSDIYYTAKDFARVRKVDAHCHINTYQPDFARQAERDGFRLITINLDDVNEPPAMDTLQRFALSQMKIFPKTVSYATTFSVRNFASPQWLRDQERYMANSFEHGAVAVKVYKVIGMTLKDSSGKMVMIDDARFDPLIDFIEQHHIPILGHLAEPKNCWLPVEQMTVRGDSSYFSRNPEYHMYLHPEMPSYEQQIAARDHMLEKHPRLRFIGAHLGSLEWSVDELAKRLDRFPNMAVDMAARVCHLQYQSSRDRKKVRDFIIKYQDRLLYATDKEGDPGSEPGDLSKGLHDTWYADWRYFTTDDMLSSREFSGKFTGLKLPRNIIDKIYRLNAEKWYPRMVATRQ